jgi:hypothetical protein
VQAEQWRARAEALEEELHGSQSQVGATHSNFHNLNFNFAFNRNFNFRSMVAFSIANQARLV